MPLTASHSTFMYPVICIPNVHILFCLSLGLICAFFFFTSYDTYTINQISISSETTTHPSFFCFYSLCPCILHSQIVIQILTHIQCPLNFIYIFLLCFFTSWNFYQPYESSPLIWTIFILFKILFSQLYLNQA